ncbi:MAG: hypothetical protein R8F63_09785 [Acidimicrobiales bacterium]|nr:hypothetical protein [Acidimicrobiales bacterium]
MEGRQPVELTLEMSDLSVDDYGAQRPDAAVFTNCHRDRADLPRRLPEFDTLGVIEGTAAGPAIDGVTHHRFARTARPGQGSLTDEPTTGLQLVLISAKDPGAEAAQALRDWADYVHIRHIAEAAVPGFRMITPYRGVSEGAPTFLHFYEMHTDDPEAAFLSMTPLVAERLGGDASDAFRSWAWHDQLRIDYVNTFRRAQPGVHSSA